MRRSGIAVAVLGLSFLANDAQGFTHVVQKGDTLASIAERYYGRIQHEKILVAANSLDAHGGTPIVPGMRLEVPALSHRRVKKGDTWPELAKLLLGAKDRSDVLSMANGSSPWLTPVEGSEIIVPYNLPVVVSTGDTIVTVAYKFVGDMNKAWVLDHYNGLKGKRLAPGDVVLVPLTDLPLTDDGKKAVTESNPLVCSQGGGEARQTQRKVAVELPTLSADVRGGRYVDAVTRGTRFLASGNLDQQQLGLVHRQLLEAYAALDAPGLAAASCAEWRKHEPSAKLDPMMMSPKLIAACEKSAP